jgi:hypothetical protein
MRRLYILLASAVIATTLIVVATGAAAQHPGPSPQPGPANNQEFLALAIAPSLLKVPNTTPNRFYPEAEAGYGTTLVEAKNRARAGCEDNGILKDQYYKNDCQGAVWVQNGWLALSTERLAPKGTTVPHRYQYAYGGAYATTRNKAIGKAIDICYSKDPKYEECVLVDAVDTFAQKDLNNHDGGSW